jgi:hypothetical protein
MPVTKIGSGFHSAADDFAALLSEAWQPGENRDVRRRSTHVGWRQPEDVGRGLVEVSDPEVASYDNDWNLNRVDDSGQIRRSRVCGRGTVKGSGPAPVEGDAVRCHRAAPVAL